MNVSDDSWIILKNFWSAGETHPPSQWKRHCKYIAIDMEEEIKL